MPQHASLQRIQTVLMRQQHAPVCAGLASTVQKPDALHHNQRGTVQCNDVATLLPDGLDAARLKASVCGVDVSDADLKILSEDAVAALELPEV